MPHPSRIAYAREQSGAMGTMAPLPGHYGVTVPSIRHTLALLRYGPVTRPSRHRHSPRNVESTITANGAHGAVSPRNPTSLYNGAQKQRR